MTKPTWFNARTVDAGTGELSIYGDIGLDGVTFESFNAEIKALGDVKTLHISIQSDGGDVSVGTAIYNVLRRHPAHKVARVEGLAASMASVILMAADEIVMPSNAFLMIHNPWGVVAGDGDALRRFGTTLDMMRQNIAGAYTARTGLPMSRVLDMMDAETWMTAAEAVKLGFADRIESPLKAAAMIKAANAAAKFKNAPLRRTWDIIREEAFAQFNSVRR